MSVAFLPSPARGVWHLGPVPVRAYAICIILGILVALQVAARRYAKIGGREGIVLAVATVAVPAGLVGARGYSILTDSQLLIGHRHDWTAVLRIWDGKIGFPGAVVAGALGAWVACRRAGVAFGPVAGAAAPGLAFGQAIGRWGNWFGQALYGRPSTLPWAVVIAPEHRVRGYENFAAFQPAFLYESAWDVLTGVLVIYAARRFLLTGDRVFAVYAAIYAIGGFWIQSLRIDPSHHFLGLRTGQWVLAAAFAAAVGYLYQTRHKHGPDDLSRTGPGERSPVQLPGSLDTTRPLPGCR
jgi:prolipoprotein diacylglyceryl transferase